MKPPSTPESRSSGDAPDRTQPPAPPQRPATRQTSGAPQRYGRQILMLVVGLAALIVSIAAVTGDRGYLDVKGQRARLSKLRAEVASLERENAILLAEVRALRTDPFVIERIAREKLGYARPGEIVFEFPPENPSVKETPPPRAAERRQ